MVAPVRGANIAAGPAIVGGRLLHFDASARVLPDYRSHHSLAPSGFLDFAALQSLTKLNLRCRNRNLDRLFV
jgi:hypothetical protein